MPEPRLSHEPGRIIGTSATPPLAEEGKLPGVVYGHGTDPVHVGRWPANSGRPCRRGQPEHVAHLDVDGTS